MCFSHLGVSLISVKPLTTENTEKKTTPKICKITVAWKHLYINMYVHIKLILKKKKHHKNQKKMSVCLSGAS